MAKKDSVTKYMEGVKNYLQEVYGEVKVEWGSTLLILEDSLRRYEQIKQEINNNGIFDINTGRKNPLLTTEKDCIATILKLTQKLGVSPWDSSKIKTDNADDDEDFIKSLTED